MKVAFFQVLVPYLKRLSHVMWKSNDYSRHFNSVRLMYAISLCA